MRRTGVNQASRLQPGGPLTEVQIGEPSHEVQRFAGCAFRPLRLETIASPGRARCGVAPGWAPGSARLRRRCTDLGAPDSRRGPDEPTFVTPAQVMMMNPGVVLEIRAQAQRS